MRNISLIFILTFLCVNCVALPSKSDIYNTFPDVAKEVKKFLTSAREQQLRSKEAVKQVKSLSFDVSLVNCMTIINSAEAVVNLWGGFSGNSPYLNFTRIDSNVSMLDIVIKDADNSDELFSFHLEPRQLYQYHYIPVVIDQDYLSSNLWDPYINNFLLFNGSLYPASKVESINPDKDPFVYNGVQIQRDMLDGQGLRNHKLYALKTGSYDVLVKATLDNNQTETALFYGLYVENTMPIVGINDHLKDKVNISYTNGKIAIDNELDNADFALYSLEGKLLKQGRLVLGKYYIDISNKAKGVYFVNIKGKNFNFSKKVLVK